MTKQGCIINPQTGRAVKTTTPLGKKLMAQAQQLDDEYKGEKVIKTAAKRAVAQKEAGVKKEAGGVLAAAAKRAIAKKPEPPKPKAAPKPKPAPEPKAEAAAPEPKADAANPTYTQAEINALTKDQIIELIFRTYKLREGLDIVKEGQRIYGVNKKNVMFNAAEIYVMRDPEIDKILKKRKKIAPFNNPGIAKILEKSSVKYAGKNEAAALNPAPIQNRGAAKKSSSSSSSSPEINKSNYSIKEIPPFKGAKKSSSSSSSSTSPPPRRLPPYPKIAMGNEAAAYFGRLGY